MAAGLVEMRPPIVLYDKGDVDLFLTTEDAENAIEIIDVRNQEYVVYDSEGKLLRFRIIERPMVGGLLRRRDVVLEEAEETASHRQELRNVVRQFLMHSGFSDESLPDELSQLIAELGRALGKALNAT